MKTITSRRTNVTSRSSFNSSAARGLASLAVAASLFGAAVPAFSQSDMDHPAEMGHPPVMDDAARQKMSERMQARLDEMAKRLHIEPSQQDAWNAYTKTVRSMFDMKPERPAADADAATIVRFRANMAAMHAQKLSQLADATVKLQDALNPAQRKMLNDMVRREGRSSDERQERHRDDRPHTP